MHRPLSIGCGKEIVDGGEEMEGEREGGHCNCLTVLHTQKEMGERAREGVIDDHIFDTQKNDCHHAPRPQRGGQHGLQAVTARRLGGEGGGALIDFKSPILWRRLHKFSRSRGENFFRELPSFYSILSFLHISRLSRVAGATHLSLSSAALHNV